MIVLFKLLRLPQTLPQKPTQTLCPALYFFVVILSNKYSKYSLFTLLSCCVSFLDPGSDKSLYQTPNLTFTTALKSRSAALEIITQGPSSFCSPWFDSFHLIYLPFSLLPLLIFRTSFCIYSSHYLSFFLILLPLSFSIYLLALRVNRYKVESGFKVLCVVNTCILNEPDQILMMQQHFH